MSFAQTLMWLSHGLYFAGWAALILAPLRVRLCWVFARTCAVVLAVICVIEGVQGGGLPLVIQMNPAPGQMPMPMICALLFIGSWQVEDAPRFNIPHKLILPGLVLTAAFGPLGLVVHMMIRDYYKHIAVKLH